MIRIDLWRSYTGLVPQYWTSPYSVKEVSARTQSCKERGPAAYESIAKIFRRLAPDGVPKIG